MVLSALHGGDRAHRTGAWNHAQRHSNPLPFYVNPNFKPSKHEILSTISQTHKGRWILIHASLWIVGACQVRLSRNEWSTIRREVRCPGGAAVTHQTETHHTIGQISVLGNDININLLLKFPFSLYKSTSYVFFGLFKDFICLCFFFFLAFCRLVPNKLILPLSEFKNSHKYINKNVRNLLFFFY